MNGIDFVIDHYIRTRSLEARENLFIVIFDYVVLSIQSARTTDLQNDHLLTALELLKWFEAPRLFTLMFKCYPHSFMKKFLKGVQKSLSSSQYRIEKQTLAVLLEGFGKLALDYNQVCFFSQLIDHSSCTLNWNLDFGDCWQMGKLVITFRRSHFSCTLLFKWIEEMEKL